MTAAELLDWAKTLPLDAVIEVNMSFESEEQDWQPLLGTDIRAVVRHEGPRSDDE